MSALVYLPLLVPVLAAAAARPLAARLEPRRPRSRSPRSARPRWP
jgi:hypothetical protein